MILTVESNDIAKQSVREWNGFSKNWKIVVKFYYAVSGLLYECTSNWVLDRRNEEGQHQKQK